MRMLFLVSLFFCIYCLSVPVTFHKVAYAKETSCTVTKRYSDGSSLKINKCDDGYSKHDRDQMAALIERETKRVDLFNKKGVVK